MGYPVGDVDRGCGVIYAFEGNCQTVEPLIIRSPPHYILLWPDPRSQVVMSLPLPYQIPSLYWVDCYVPAASNNVGSTVLPEPSDTRSRFSTGISK